MTDWYYTRCSSRVGTKYITSVFVCNLQCTQVTYTGPRNISGTTRDRARTRLNQDWSSSPHCLEHHNLAMNNFLRLWPMYLRVTQQSLLCCVDFLRKF